MHIYCRNNIQDKLECGICKKVFTDLSLFIKHREVETFFSTRENSIQKIVKERKTNEVGGSELTSDTVRTALKRPHFENTEVDCFNEDSHCCVCHAEEPPNHECIDDNEIHWLGCDSCCHWVHIGLCVPIHETDGDFVCPCHNEE